MIPSVLIIEDESILSHAMRDYLTRRGYEAVVAGSGEEGLKLLRDSEMDLVVLDYQLPGIDGIDVLRQVKQAAPATEVVMVTAHGSEKIAVEAMRAGSFDYLTKPVAVDRGFPQPTVVWLFAFGAGCMMAGNLLGGWLSDRVGRERVFVLGTVVAILGIGCLALTRGPQDLPLLVLYTVSGFGFGMRIAQLSTIPADVFAGPHLGAILGVVQAGGGMGGAIGPFLGGWLFDVTGSYELAFLAACIAVAGSAVAAWIAARPGTRGPNAQT
jgi:CheY-like chemotaxis protein